MNSWKNRLKVAADYWWGRTVCAGRPVEVSIELTSRCNLKCVMCPRDDHTRRGLGYMRMETFRRIIDQVRPYMELAYLHLAGEPLLHPEFAAFIAYAAEQGVATGLSTNGTVLDERRGERVLASPLHTLIISIDGTDRETYRRVRGADSFEKVVGQARRFLARKRAVGRGPYTVVQMICMRENIGQAAAFVRQWKRWGADAVRLKRFFNFAGRVEDRSVAAGGGSQGRRRGVRIRRQNGAGAKRRPPCYLLWRQLAFYYDGTAVACCHDFLHETELGNIHERSIEELWNSAAMVRLRQMHREGRQAEIPLCAGCNQPRVSAPLVAGTALLNATTTKKALILIERLAHLTGRQAPY